MQTLNIRNIKLKRANAIKAAELFIQGLREEPSGDIPLSKAIELLQAAYESIKYVTDPAGIDD